ncbi:MAG: VOC family protein [Chloroflexi bacterium]|nr:VOC family protein [Chloroflexota bacterium]MCH8801368.1 VOC family protein [Chloroflexota bacterium]MCH8893556.1 VOC family protein [Chloroflexota bacterium]MCH9016951.1 VOC family protein [Chloroflexota bacterium]MCI0789661.1 VOC family protein [Chloroflexota bacterium]
MIKLNGLGHLVIRVRDAQRSEDFYHKVLGLEVRNRTRGGKMIFFTSNPDVDHELAVAELGADAVGPFPDQVGLYHMAWELADMDELKDAYQVVLDNNVEIAGFGDHGETKGLYIRDPDGIEIELFVAAPEFEKTPLEEILTGASRQGAAAG